MTTSPKHNPHEEKLAQLARAIEEYESGEYSPTIIDPVAEERKSAVRHRALLLLNSRRRSRKELFDRLSTPTQSQRKRQQTAESGDDDVATDAASSLVDPTVINEVLDDLERVGLINDDLFAEQWVRERHQRRGKTRRVLDQELIHKGVAEEVRLRALSQLSDEDELHVARALVEKEVAKVGELADRRHYDKALRSLVGKLARRGFGTSLALNLCREALEPLRRF